ncbi:hypothetical protein EVAR_102392_1 [Eumeta japonica]|uniref:Uncharacterized protein n=1 Tax=Eumeta variegata TaxID=151549 RepID=A0A4C1YJW4_EUMVA|nr:hypothetical protein EVAR_102392_1 [Eumeta japonica]
MGHVAVVNIYDYGIAGGNISSVRCKRRQTSAGRDYNGWEITDRKALSFRRQQLGLRPQTLLCNFPRKTDRGERHRWGSSAVRRRLDSGRPGARECAAGETMRRHFYGFLCSDDEEECRYGRRCYRRTRRERKIVLLENANYTLINLAAAPKWAQAMRYYNQQEHRCELAVFAIVFRPNGLKIDDYAALELIQVQPLKVAALARGPMISTCRAAFCYLI